MDLTSPILEICPGHWYLQAWVDARYVCGVTDATADKTTLHFEIGEMPLKIGKRKVMGILKFGRLVSKWTTSDQIEGANHTGYYGRWR